MASLKSLERNRAAGAGDGGERAWVLPPLRHAGDGQILRRVQRASDLGAWVEITDDGQV